MEKSSFFNSVDGDRNYNATDWASYFASFIGNGVFPLPGNNLQVVAGNSGLSITIKPGKAWINGYFYENTEELMFSLSPAHGVLNRIDRVVIRLDLQSRSIVAAVKSSNATQRPTAPILQRDANIHELCLADVVINAGAIAITQSKITDKRINKKLCGIVTGTVQELDTTAFNSQLQAWFSEYQNASEAEYSTFVYLMESFMQTKQTDFNTWFSSVQAVLDENAVAHLYNMISELATTEQSINTDTLPTTITIDNVTAHDIIYSARFIEGQSSILTINVSQANSIPLHRRIVLWVGTPDNNVDTIPTEISICVNVANIRCSAILSGFFNIIGAMTVQ